jgi:CubicO group peptidase (beta-lactamase class C family)
MNAISRRSLLARGGLLLAAGAAAVNTPIHALAANPQARSGNFKSIDMAMEQAVRDGTVAGVVATAAGPDSMIYEGTFGTANTVTGATMRTDTVFWLLSMTKAFTATACMQLIEQGRINPENDAAIYLPELANPMVLEGFDGDGQPRLRPAKRAIKVRHLLTHSSGYTYSIWSDALTRY